MRYVVFCAAGKQYEACEGEEILLETRAGNKKMEFDQVLLVNDDGKVKLGTPFVKGARVSAEVVGWQKGDKIVVRKYKAKSRYHRSRGHRTKFLRVKIEKVLTS